MAFHQFSLAHLPDSSAQAPCKPQLQLPSTLNGMWAYDEEASLTPWQISHPSWRDEGDGRCQRHTVWTSSCENVGQQVALCLMSKVRHAYAQIRSFFGLFSDFVVRPCKPCSPSSVLLAAYCRTRWPPNTLRGQLRSQPNHTAPLLVHLVVVVSQHHAARCPSPTQQEAGSEERFCVHIWCFSFILQVKGNLDRWVVWSHVKGVFFFPPVLHNKIFQSNVSNKSDKALSLLSLFTSFFTAGLVAWSPCHMAILRGFWDECNSFISILWHGCT